MSLNILITGSEGYVGQRLVERLRQEHHIVGLDIIDNPAATYTYQRMDIRSPELSELMKKHAITHVVHLASIVQASDSRERDYDIDVNGTKNVLEACIAAGVEHITVTSSGAAYGYHADNPQWLSESDPLRGNEHFAYSYHKRLVEELLADYRQQQPQLQQLILRPGTILGATTRNQITNLFEQKRLLQVKGAKSPFVFIWDEDVVEIILQGVTQSKSGQFNLAGDGALSLCDIAKRLNKPLLPIPAWLLKLGLTLGHALKLTRYSAQQLDFLRYRPVLDNRALKEDFGFKPAKTSAEVFEFYLNHNQGLNHE